MGCDGMSWNNSAIENVKKIGVKSLNKTVEVVLNKYVDPVTPHDFGELEKGNATVHATNSNPVAKIVNKGNFAPYNVRVHEMLDPNVRWTKPGTGPKFIENPFNKHAVKTFQKLYREELRKNGY